MSRRRDKKPSDKPTPTTASPQSSQSHSESAVNAESGVNASSPPIDIAQEKDALEKPGLFPGLPSLSRIMSVVMLVIGIFAVGVLFYQVMAGFFIPLFLAALLVVIFRPVHEWIYCRVGGRQRLAAVGTTSLILVIVLLPVILVISVAATQFTSMVRHVGSNNVADAIDRVRDRFGLSLPHAEKFQRLNDLADTFDDGEPEEMTKKTNEAITLVRFLHENVDGPDTADPEAALAEQNLEKFLSHVDADVSGTAEDELSDQATASKKGELNQAAVIASASIRSWMHTLLGGTFRSQLRLIPTPSASSLANLLRENREALQPRFVQLTSATGGLAIEFLIGLGILVVSVYFFLIDGPAMIGTLMRLSPLDDDYERRLLLEFDRTSRAVVLASVLSALAQGVLATIAYYFAGLESLVLLFLVTSLMALVPFLGAASVWIPCALWLGAVEQHYTEAIALAIFGTLIISSIDNVIKVFVLHGRSQLHPLFALLSVLGGVRVFGPIGILVGPMVVVFLQTLLEILNHELAEQPPSELADPTAEGLTAS